VSSVSVGCWRTAPRGSGVSSGIGVVGSVGVVDSGKRVGF
jgi:hypothetical protein